MIPLAAVRGFRAHLPVGRAAVVVPAADEVVATVVVEDAGFSQGAVATPGVGAFVGPPARLAATLLVGVAALVGPAAGDSWNTQPRKQSVNQSVLYSMFTVR